MENLEKTLATLRKLEATLFRQVLVYSFIFPLLAILAQYDKFGSSFHALTELLAGTFGVAGIMRAYLSSLKHPIERELDVLDFEAQYSGRTVTFALVASATLFYGFYFFARQANEFCLAFLCVGVFLFFWAMTTAVTTISRAEAQQFVWKDVDEKTRQSWRDRRQEHEGRFQKIDSLIDEGKADSQVINDTVRRLEGERRREFVVSFIKMPVKWTLPFRQRIGWVTRDEQAEIASRNARRARLLEEKEGT